MEGDDYVKIITGIGALGWVGNAINQYIKSRAEVDGKKLTRESELNNLKKDIEELKETIIELEEKIINYRTISETESEGRIRSEQQLATINIAFDIIYIQLQRILGGDEEHAELLQQLKKYIDGGTRNMGT